MSVIVTLAVGVVGAISALGAPAVKTVHLRGTAYEFNKVHVLLTGATIRVAEFPRLKAVVGPNGRYDLAVPNHARITPYIVDPGYHTVYLQTFTTAGEDLANVNFQTPTDAVYNGLVVLLHVPVDAHGNPVKCAIVSTFNTRNVRDLSYDGFIAYGAHGVAGATATAAPTLPKPTYFNQNVFPDPSQTKSSDRWRRRLDERADAASTRSPRTARRPGSRASWRVAGLVASSTRTPRGACTSSASPTRPPCPRTGRAAARRRPCRRSA